MTVTDITIPSDIESGLTSYAKALLADPGKYVVHGIYDLSTRPAVDINDPKLPIINDDFLLLNHDITSVNYGAEQHLQTCLYKWLFDIAFPPTPILVPYLEFLEKETGKKFVEHRGNFLYPKDGYMGWHTNSDVPGYRIYAAYTEVEDGSYFKYLDTSGDTPKMVVSYDKPGWNVRMFPISNNAKDLLWHCVYSQGAPRLSYGFRFEDLI
jgi:hypothetical protein